MQGDSIRGLWRLLRGRFKQARLGQVAGSLTFTTLLGLVPLLTVALALFSAFPGFATFQEGLERLFLQSLVPDFIARPVLQAVSQFAGKAARLGAVGMAGVVLSALVMMLTIDRALNRIWRVRQPRPVGARLTLYLLAMTLGPLLVGVFFTAASYAFTASRGWGPVMPVVLATALEAVEIVTLLAGVTALFRYLPNTPVAARDALIGAAFVVVAFTIAKEALGWYVSSLTVFAAVYGAFATLPILLLWIYIVWVIVLSGAVLAAAAPALRGGTPALDGRLPGARFTLALRVLQALAGVRDTEQPTLELATLSSLAKADPLEVRTVADEMVAWGWLVHVPPDAHGSGGYLLRLHPSQCPMHLPVQAFLVAPQAGNEAWLARSSAPLTLQQLL
ncbi:MAG: hypothetical protein RI972_756 [Pseudomonadota bacterium]